MESFKYRIISSGNRDNLISSFIICTHFVSFSCLMDLAKNSNTILNKNRESGHPFLILDVSGNDFSFFSFYSESCKFVIYGLYYVKVHFFFFPLLLCWNNKESGQGGEFNYDIFDTLFFFLPL
jgi:hypothetical protein